MRIKSCMALIALLFCIEHVNAQDCTSSLTGRVEDVLHQPIIGATLLLLPGQHGQATDAYGNFNVEKLCAGVYTVRAQSVGYHPVEFQLTISGTTNHIIVLQEETTELSEVVVQHHAPSHTDFANNFVRMNEKQLSENASKSLGETLKEITGVNSIQTGPSIFKPVIHGVHSQRILILNNGIRQEGQQWGAEHAPEIDPFIASNIVVIKDAGAIKYGTDALGGVIVVNPPDLPTTNDLSGELNLIGQSNGRSGIVSGTIEGGIQAWPGFGWRVQGTGKQSGDFHAADYNLSNTGFKELNYSLAAGYHKENTGIEVFYSHFQTELGILAGTIGNTTRSLENALTLEPPQYTEPFTYKIKNPRQQVQHDLIKLSAHAARGQNKYTVQYGLQLNQRKEFDVRRGYLNDIPSIDLRLVTQTLDAEWERLQHTGTLSIGLNAMYQNNDNIFGTERIPFIPDFTTKTVGAYAVKKIRVKKWTFDGGIRYDLRHSDVVGYDYRNILYRDALEFHNANLIIGVNRTMAKNGMYRMSISSAWRPPHVSELYSFGRHQSAAAVENGLLLDENNNIIPFSESDFKNEKAVKWVNTYQYNTDRVKLEVTGYYNYIFNYIYLKPIGVSETFTGPTPYFHYDQTDAAFLGLDLSVYYQLSRSFVIGYKNSLLRATDVRNNSYLYNIPSNRFEASVRYEKPQVKKLKSFYLESKFRYVTRQNRAPEEKSIDEIMEAQEEGKPLPPFDFAAAPPGYFLVEISTGISCPIKNSRLDFRLSVTNLLNTDYREYTNRMRYYADDLGRNIILSAKYIF